MRSQPPAATRSGRRTAGSMLHPRRRFVASGGAAGTAPWATATPAAPSVAAKPLATAVPIQRRMAASLHDPLGTPHAAPTARRVGRPRRRRPPAIIGPRPFQAESDLHPVLV